MISTISPISTVQFGHSRPAHGSSERVSAIYQADTPDVFFGSSKTKRGLRVGLWAPLFFLLTAFGGPAQAQTIPEVKPNVPVLTSTGEAIHPSIRSDHRPTSCECGDDGELPAEVSEELRGLQLTSAQQVALAEYLKPRVSRIVIHSNAPTGPEGSAVPRDFEDFFRFFPGGGPDNAPNNQKITGLGTGFTCQSDGLIITNNHVIDTVLDHGGKIEVFIGHKRYEAKVIATDPVADLAFLKIDTGGEELPTIHFADEVAQGEILAIMGQPTGFKNVFTFGVISALYQTLEGNLPFHLTDAAVNPGNSGGPAVNLDGELAGHVFAKVARPDVDNQGFMMPIDYLSGALKRLHEGKPINNRLSIGIQIMSNFRAAELTDADITKEFAREQDQRDVRAAQAALRAHPVNEFGMTVVQVVDKNGAGEPTLAASSGAFRLGDVVVAVNGQRFESQAEFLSRVKSIFQDQSFTLTVIREGKEVTLEMNGK